MTIRSTTTSTPESEATSRSLAEVLAAAAEHLDNARLEVCDLVIDAADDPDALTAVVRVLGFVRDAALDVREARDYAGRGGAVLS